MQAILDWMWKWFFQIITGSIASILAVWLMAWNWDVVFSKLKSAWSWFFVIYEVPRIGFIFLLILIGFLTWGAWMSFLLDLRQPESLDITDFVYKKIHWHWKWTRQGEIDESSIVARCQKCERILKNAPAFLPAFTDEGTVFTCQGCKRKISLKGSYNKIIEEVITEIDHETRSGNCNSYNEDQFFDLLWRWKWPEGTQGTELKNVEPINIQPYCPDCDVSLKESSRRPTVQELKDGNKIMDQKWKCPVCNRDFPYIDPSAAKDLVLKKLRENTWRQPSNQ